MKKFVIAFASLLISFGQIALAGDYTTPDGNNAYTMAALSQIDGSGVTDLGNGQYAMDNNVTVTAGNTFSISGAKALLMGDGVTLTLECESDFRADEERVLITRNDFNDAPRGILMTWDCTADNPLVFRNIDFEYAQLRNFAVSDVKIERCTFKYANGALTSSGALSLGEDGSTFSVVDCIFEQNTVPAIGGAANYACGLTVDGCEFTYNNTSDTNKPQLNLTVGGSQKVTIKNCVLEGGGYYMVGGIAVGNLLMMPGDNIVEIENCTIKEHRYGVTGVGPMKMYIRDNTFIDNNFEHNPMNGGSGISLAGYNYGLDAIISGNHIENSLWGITIIGCNDVNLGEIGNPESPGRNVFVNNGNSGEKYDVYNNQANSVMAQNNTWSVDEQTAEQIEGVIFHKADDAKLGEVVYMPAFDPSGIADIAADGDFIVNGNRILCAEPVAVYSVAGVELMPSQLNPSIEHLPAGLYIVTSASATYKFAK